MDDRCGPQGEDRPEALREAAIVPDPARRYDVHQKQIYTSKKQFLANELLKADLQ
jgi:hypothetical protein